MFLFKKKKEDPKQISIVEEKRYPIPYSKGYRGFKSFQVSVYGYEESEKNMRYFYDKDLSNSVFEFVSTTDNDYKLMCLYIDNLKVGAIFDPNQVYAIENGLIEKIHAEPKKEIVLGNKCTEERHRLSIFVKYKLSE